MNKLLGRKIGMSHVYNADGILIPVTLLEVGPCYITQIKTNEKDKYTAVQIGFGLKKEKHMTKPALGHFKKANLEPLAHLREVRMEDVSAFEVGKSLHVTDWFKEGDVVHVTATSKGKGFQGVVKRHHFHGGPKTHGQSDRMRAPGSLGQSSYPSRVFKNMRMAGRMGNEVVTVKNLKIERILSARNIVMIKGAVPGGTNGLVEIRKK